MQYFLFYFFSNINCILTYENDFDKKKFWIANLILSHDFDRIIHYFLIKTPLRLMVCGS